MLQALRGAPSPAVLVPEIAYVISTQQLFLLVQARHFYLGCVPPSNYSFLKNSLNASITLKRFWTFSQEVFRLF